MKENSPSRNRKPRWRAARRQAMKAQGITPANRQDAWCVVLENGKIIPAWLESRAIDGLGTIPNQFWLRPRDAKALIRLARTWGVYYDVTKTEYKRCLLCGRPCIGSEAEKLRTQMESGSEGRALPCGPNCEKEHQSRLWLTLSKVQNASRSAP